MDLSPTLLAPLFVALLLLTFVAFVGWWWERGRLSRANRGRQRVARRGEDEAEDLLLDEGYEIVDRQAPGAWSLWIDDDEVAVACRADLLVARDGETFVAEVKTGAEAPDPRRPATRRQLLEYAIAFDVDGILLVDMAARRVVSVRVPVERA